MKCPHCAEDIQDAAVICKHCGKNPKTQPITSEQRNWIMVNHIGGSIGFWTLIIALVGFCLSQLSTLPGGLATVLPAFSNGRIELVGWYWAKIGAIVGFVLIGPLAGQASARAALRKLKGEDI